jgi:hypothetical protein
MNTNQEQQTLLFCNEKAQPGMVFDRLTAEEIKLKFGFGYMFSSLNDSVQSCNRLGLDPSFSAFGTIDNPEDVLVVHKISDKIGWSLTTTVPIKNNTIILEYVGEDVNYDEIIYTNNTISFDPTYSLGRGLPSAIWKSQIDLLSTKNLTPGQMWLQLQDFYFKKDSECTKNLSSDWITVSAAKKGNIARFAMSLPEESPYPMFADIKLANLIPHLQIGHDGQEHYFLVTTRDIEPFEELGFDYGEGYWDSKCGQEDVCQAYWQENLCPLYLNAITGDIYNFTEGS